MDEKDIQAIQNRLIEVAKQRRTIYYSVLFSPYEIDPHSDEAADILGKISRDSHKDGGYLLSSVVVTKETNKTEMPGAGFFKEFKKYYNEKDEMKFWIDRLNETYAYWSQQPQNKP